MVIAAIGTKRASTLSKSKITPTKTNEFWTPERCFIRELVNSEDIGGFSLAETRVEPGITTELHKLGVDEWYVIRRGRGKMEVGGKPWFDVSPGDVISIPAQVSQRIENTGSEDLIFECVCLPRFVADTYTSLES